jgi:hypothetical protein
MQKQRKTKYQISQILNKYLLEIIRLLQNTTQIAVDKISKQLQRQNIKTKLQKLKESQNTRFCRSGRQNITPKIFFGVGSAKAMFGSKPRSIKSALIPC